MTPNRRDLEAEAAPFAVSSKERELLSDIDGTTEALNAAKAIF